MAMWMMIGSMAMQAIGSANASEAAEENAQRVAAEKSFEAAQLRQQAALAPAVAQRQALEQQRQSRLVQSRTLAVAAASGAGVSDPTIVNMLARTAGEGTYRANAALYGGEERARLLRMQAAAADYEGQAAIAGGDAKSSAIGIQGMSGIFSGGSSLYAKYGQSLFGSNSGGGEPFGGSFGT